ncbi:MAG: saccharopine dehydrogenase NADP-binding domain-containing protein, partial [Candidatus Binatia bacterium]
MQFNGKLLIIGCGSVSQCAVPLVLKFMDMPAKNITIMDFVDNRARVKDALDRGVNYVFDRVTEENYRELLAQYVGPGDLIIDLAWNIECNAMLQWCRDRQVLYVNTSVEVWNPYQDSQRNDPTQYTLYHRHMTMRKMIEKWGDNKGTSAVVDHGANPGLVSHFTKHALLGIAG